ncbi:LamG-like jellyroll fold domain-containing protein [Streptacidiphilus sp. N1-10]|uniref:LamG-like jellyroll fold domain-containing protein n=1 Tax=Streptacidiphilus jeojiensis TaxID=3229225 RepID=A0ABV6XQ44_9ACTN
MPIPSLTDVYSTMVANPDGTFTQTQSADPQRVLKDGAWADLNATLVANPDGTLSPKTSSEPLTLSAGGSGPLATMATTDGKKLSLTAPFTLPSPTLSGDTALYPEVAPGIDLSVKATDTGGFSTVFVVKNAAAAANPLLTHLSFTTATTGVSISADAQGNLTAADSTGTAVFSAPTPQVWDSSTGATESPSATSATTAAAGTRSANQQAKAATAQDDASATPTAPSTAADAGDASTTDGPGSAAQVAPIATTASGSTVTLSPPASALTGASVTYPVFVDPAWLSQSPGQQGVTWTQQAYPTTNNLTNGDDNSTSNSSYPGVGVCGTYPEGGSCIPSDVERSYWQFDVSPFNTALINSATFNVSETYSADASCTTTYPVVAAGIWGTIGPGTTWNNPPAADVAQFSVNKDVGGADRSGCAGNVPVSFDITSGLKNLYASQGTVTHLVMRIHGDESNAYAFKRFTHKANLTIQYDQAPAAPTNLKTLPLSGGINAGLINSTTGTWSALDYCTTTTVGVDDNWGWVNSSGTTLNATAATTSDAQSQYNVSFHLWDVTDGTAPDYNWTSGYANKGTNVDTPKLTTPATLQNGHAYNWVTADSDGLIGSPNSATCHFRVDTTPPTISFGDSTDFPRSGSGLSATKTVGLSGTFPITVADPAPSGVTGAQVSKVDCVRYSWDPTLATAKWQCGGSHTSITQAPEHWGTNILYAQAMDWAGNKSQITSYSFYAPWAPTTLNYGDVNGDAPVALPDVVAPDPATGDLIDYQQARDFTPSSAITAGNIAAPASQAPDGTSWNGYRVVHRGDITGTANVDDLFVHKDGTSPTTPGDQWLYLYANLGTNNGHFGNADGSGIAAVALHRPDCDPANGDCTGSPIGDTWANSYQITPIGSSEDTPDPTGGYQNGLLDIEGGKLWFYAYLGGNGALTADGQPTKFAPPILVDTTVNWNNTDLMVPGDAAATGHPALWARDRSSGAIIQYAIKFNSANVTVPYAPAVVTDNATEVTCTDNGDGVSNNCPVNEITGLTKVNQIGTAPASAIPTIGADSDLTGDNIPDLWSQSATGAITIWPGVTSGGTSETAVTGLGRYDDQWLLNHSGNPSSGTPDATDTPDAANGRNPATAGADTSYTGPTYTTTDHPAAPTAAGGSAVFNGHNYFTTGQTITDSTKDYTLSAWVKLNGTPTTDQTAVCLRDATSARCAAYLQYTGGTIKNWRFISPSGDGATVTFASAVSTKAMTTGWTRLVAVFNAADPNVTGSQATMTLYVNGTYAASATNPSPWATTGGVQLIGGATGGTAAPGTIGSFNGNIADVRTYAYALTPTEVSALN